MIPGMEARMIALRVLTAIVEKRHPDPIDVQALRAYAPAAATAPEDELACDVIQQAITVRARVARSANHQ